MTGVLKKKKEKHGYRWYTGRMTCKVEGRDLSDASTSKGMENIASKPSELKLEAWDRFSQPSKRINPANTLILDC